MESQGMPLNVFVSCSARDAGMREELVRHLQPLVGTEVIRVWHAGMILGGDAPQGETEAELRRAGLVLALVSASYLAKEEVETSLSRIAREKAGRGLRVIPVLVSSCGWEQVPELKELKPLPADGVPIALQPNRDAALATIAKEIGVIAPALRAAAATPLGPAKISLRRLPHGGEHFLGREAELSILDEAWASRGHTRVVSIIAMGGAGKSSLVSRWLRGLGTDYRGARRVFDYSFYKQGTTEARVASADPFFAEALGFFGDPEAARRAPFERADRLAELVRAERTLLVLDGLEPLQAPPGEADAGRLKDRALAAFLDGVVAENPGLVVLTSRERLSELGADGGATRTIKLDRLPSPVGVKLLQAIGVTGPDDELNAAVESFKGHALALTLLGNLLMEQHGGDVRKHREIPPLFEADGQGEPARRAMAAYYEWLPGPERAILRLLGLFDRPAPAKALEALRAEPVAGLNDGLVGMGKVEWNKRMERLRKAGLVERTAPEDVDAHPLVRGYFGEALKGTDRAAWEEGNRRLYGWYAKAAKERPDTAEEMEPLYAAVMHGCRAGLHQEAFDEVFWKRIRRFKEHYSTRKLGAFGADLSALAGFFEEPWTRPVTALREASRSFVLATAGFALRALGRLPEAVAPMRAAVQGSIAREDWKEAAIQASNLSELHLTLGRLPEAIETARQSVELADRSGDAFQRMSNRTTLADALHQAGQPDEAARLFGEAEAMQKEMQPAFPLLYSLRGYRYCDLLLSRGEAEAVLRRAEKMFEWRVPNDPVLDIALDHLALARAHLALHPNAPETRTHFDEAVARLREAGNQSYLPWGLAHRAAFHRQLHNLDAATRDLDEALRLATRGQMRLHEADARLERTRLRLAQKNPTEARAELDRARSLITQMGYGRRTPEVAALARSFAAGR